MDRVCLRIFPLLNFPMNAWKFTVYLRAETRTNNVAINRGHGGGAGQVVFPIFLIFGFKSVKKRRFVSYLHDDIQRTMEIS